ncbi:MAG TPA: hypothetical protein VFE23_12280, partial [Usitatibacter sp.]|nr:hypothetical protein [Usitatibacter sp.]
AYALIVPPSIPWAMVPIFVFAIGFAMAMPSITLINLDLFPTRRGMAASLQGFVSGMVNVLTAGVISPLLWDDPHRLAAGMLAMMLLGFGFWRGYLALARRKPVMPPPIA